MIDSVMHRLTYENPPSYRQYSSYREYLRKVSGYACAYCTITESENPGATFNIEHFRPEALFPDFVSVCDNLRYSCPRCNSYKSSLWIPMAEGCIRDCEKCTQKVCKTDIERFVDVLTENPGSMIYLGEDNKLYALSGSRPANYTIKYLRLNRSQLVKLRYVRRFMDSWHNDLLVKKKDAFERLTKIKDEQQTFLDKRIAPSTQKEQTYHDAMETMYELLVMIAEESLSHIEEEIDKLSKLMTYREGKDSEIGN